MNLDELDYLIQAALYGIQDTLNRLENALVFLNDNVSRELQNLKEEKRQYTPNRSGIVQGSGATVDQLCVRLAIEKDNLQELLRLKKALDKKRASEDL